MVERPTFSVVIPVFNSASTVKKAIDSVINQTYPVNEIIVVNNNSTDNINNILQPLANRVTLVNCLIQGVSSARNLGVEIATSKYIAFLDADDYWFLDKLEKQLGIMQNLHSDNSIFGCYSDYFISGKKVGSSIKSKTDESALTDFRISGHLPCITSSWIISRKEYLELGGMDPKLRTAQDFEFACRAVANGFDFKISRHALVGYTISPGSITHNNYLEQFYRAQYYRKMYFDNLPAVNFEDFLSRIKSFSAIWRKARSSKLIRMSMISYSQGKNLRSALFVALATLVSPHSAWMKAKRQLSWK